MKLNKDVILLFIATAVIIGSCKQHTGLSKKNTKHSYAIYNSIKTKKTETQLHVDSIDFPCAVIVQPDHNYTEKLKKSSSADDYNTIIDDDVYYMNESTGYLDSVKLRQIEKESRGSMVFKTASGNFAFKLDSLAWRIILFNGKGKPKISDLTSFKEDYDKYMDTPSQ
jgi:hypothetical protein